MIASLFKVIKPYICKAVVVGEGTEDEHIEYARIKDKDRTNTCKDIFGGFMRALGFKAGMPDYPSLYTAVAEERVVTCKVKAEIYDGRQVLKAETWKRFQPVVELEELPEYEDDDFSK